MRVVFEGWVLGLGKGECRLVGEADGGDILGERGDWLFIRGFWEGGSLSAPFKGRFFFFFALLLFLKVLNFS